MAIKEFRAEHREYDDMPDDLIAERLYERHKADYSDMTKDQFKAKFLGSTAPPPPPAHSEVTAAAPAVAPSPQHDTDAILPGVPLAVRAGLGAATAVAEGGGLPYLANLPQRGLGEVTEILRGLGPLAVGLVHAASLPGRVAGEAAVNAVTGGHASAASEEAAQAGRAFSKAAPDVLRETLGNLHREVVDPGGELIRRPVGTSLDALALADAPSLALKGAAGVGARLGAREFAQAAARAGHDVSVGETLGRTSRAAEEAIPIYGAAMERGRDINRFRKNFSIRTKESAGEAARYQAEQDAAFKGLREPEQANLTQEAMGLTSIPENPTRPSTILERLLGKGPVQPSDREALMRARAWYRENAGKNEANQIAKGLLGQREADLRKWQPARITAAKEAGPAYLEHQMTREAAPRIPVDIKPLEAEAAIQGRLMDEAMKRAEAAKAAEQGAQVPAAAAPEVAPAAPPVADDMAAAFGDGEELKPSPEQTLEDRYSGWSEEPIEAPAAPAPLDPNVRRRFDALIDALGARHKQGKLLEEVAAEKGRVPALEDLEADTQRIKDIRGPGAEQPVYVPMRPGRMERLRAALPHLFPEPARGSTPASLERSVGSRFLRGNYVKPLGEIAAQHQRDLLAFEKNSHILEDLVADPKARRVGSISDVDWKRESLIAPDAFLSKVGGEVSGASGALKEAAETGDVTGAFEKAMKATVHGSSPGAAPPGRLFAIPKHMADEFAGQVSDLPAYLRVPMQIAFDRPNDYLRWTALVLRPGFYVNNLVGNTALAALSGADARLLPEAIRTRGAMPDAIKGSGFTAIEAPPTSMKVGALKGAMKMVHGANEGIDDLSRYWSYLSETERIAQKKSIMETGQRLAAGMNRAEKLAMIGPEGEAAALEHVNRFLNDYTVQSPFQRRVLRRIMPFQSFLVHMGRLAMKLPFKNPMRAALLAKAAEIGNEYQADQFREVGVDPKDVAPWRMNQLPVRKTDTGAVTWGSGGFNPASGLGAGNADMVSSPGLGAIGNVLADQAGPIPQEILAILRHGHNSLGLPFKKPGVKSVYGTDQFVDDNDKPVGPPIPGPVDMLRFNTPLLQLIEKLAQPNETYDLVGDPSTWPEGYLPDRPVGRGEDKKVVKRKYGYDDAASGYLGFPRRKFTREEMEVRRKKKSQEDDE